MARFPGVPTSPQPIFDLLKPVTVVCLCANSHPTSSGQLAFVMQCLGVVGKGVGSIWNNNPAVTPMNKGIRNC